MSMEILPVTLITPEVIVSNESGLIIDSQHVKNMVFKAVTKESLSNINATTGSSSYTTAKETITTDDNNNNDNIVVSDSDVTRKVSPQKQQSDTQQAQEFGMNIAKPVVSIDNETQIKIDGGNQRKSILLREYEKLSPIDGLKHDLFYTYRNSMNEVSSLVLTRMLFVFISVRIDIGKEEQKNVLDVSKTFSKVL